MRLKVLATFWYLLVFTIPPLAMYRTVCGLIRFLAPLFEFRLQRFVPSFLIRAYLTIAIQSAL